MQSSTPNKKTSDPFDRLKAGSLNVLVFGAGAIGTYFGGSFALAGHNIVFVEQPKMVEQLRERGLRLDLTIDESVALRLSKGGKKITNHALRI